MNEFDLFNEAFNELLSTNNFISINEKSQNDMKHDKIAIKKCLHSNIESDSGVTICLDCGEEVNRTISTDKEWRFYGEGGNDPNRCHLRKTDERSIYKDVEGMNFPENIVSLANEIYTEVTKCNENEYKIYRGKSRKAIVFACIFNSYKILNQPIGWESLSKSFGLGRRECLNGLKTISLNSSKKSPVRTAYITPIHLIEEIMDKFSATKLHKEEVFELYKRIENKSYKLNRSRPQSIASSIVYYWIKKTGKNISIKEFTEKVKLSEITIDKISKEIEEILSKDKKSRKDTKNASM
jgi:transcription initiation factor TFIIIB Brf1 subunit/transcription initiation factor TFIIB